MDYVLYKNSCNEHILRYMCEMCVLWNLLWGTNTFDKEGHVLTQPTLGNPENKESPYLNLVQTLHAWKMTVLTSP